ncbi:ABC transporter C family member [Trichinella pseudospiralis]
MSEATSPQTAETKPDVEAGKKWTARSTTCDTSTTIRSADEPKVFDHALSGPGDGSPSIRSEHRISAHSVANCLQLSFQAAKLFRLKCHPWWTILHLNTPHH